jgi:LPS export ABC transporter protein LptC
MKRKLRVFFFAFIALSIAGLIVLVAFHYMTRKGIEVTVTEDRQIAVKIHDIHYSRTRDGRVEWVLDARSATSFKVEDVMVFDTVRLVFYAKDGRPYKLSAREGRFDENSGVVEATGDVKIESVDGTYTLTTEKIRYLSSSKEITSQDRVNITTGSMDVSGIGFKVEIDAGKMYLHKDVRAVIKSNAI